MYSSIVLLTVIVNTFYVENKIIPDPDGVLESSEEITEKKSDAVIVEGKYDPNYSSEDFKSRNTDISEKPCAVMVLSNSQNSGVHSLVRKYRYDARGTLIPSSVRYFLKLPHGGQSKHDMVQLNDQAFSPLGGFIRYYKEVPPVPQSW